MSRINNMTFGELRNELANCNNSTRKEIIRNLMYIRYKQHLAKKEKINQMKKEFRKSKIRQIKQRIKMKYRPEPVKDIESIGESIGEGDILDANDFGEKIYNRDKTNNSLMQRLSTNIDIKKMKEDTLPKKTKDFVSPFTNNMDEQYASFN